MKTSCHQIQLNEAPVIEMIAGGYLAIITPTVGSNIARLLDCKSNIEILRYDEIDPVKKIAYLPELFGHPTLYIPNRLNHGRLRTSDAIYQLPVNEERFDNYIHGFLHTRNHTVIEMKTDGDRAIAKTQYIYDERDSYFEYFPVKFRADYEFILDENGMNYHFTLTNLSDKQMPYGVCSHTTFKAPSAKDADIRLQIPALKRCIIGERCLSTGEFQDLSAYDEKYVKGTQEVHQIPIDNDMYLCGIGELDGQPFYGAIMTDIVSNKRICYEVDKTFQFFIVWNDGGDRGYYCPEPMTWMIDAPNLDLPADITGYVELAPGESKTVWEHIFIK